MGYMFSSGRGLEAIYVQKWWDQENMLAKWAY